MLIETKESKIIYNNISQDTIKIDYLVVKPRYRNNGIGRKVVESLIKKCKSEGIRNIKIDAYYKTKSFWEKLGFEVDNTPQIIDGIRQDYHNGIYKIK